VTVTAAFIGTWRTILTSKTLLSTMLLAVVLYAFYYPAPYAQEAAQKLPVVVVDQENSALSRALILELDATRAVRVVDVVPNVEDARSVMQSGTADGVVLVAGGLERQLLVGAPGAGVAVWVNATYLLRASTIGDAVTSVLQSLAARRLAPGTQASRAGLPVRIVTEPLFNRSGGYKGYVFPAVAVIIVQQTLLFGAATFMAGRRRTGTWRMKGSEYIGSLAAFATVGTLGCLFLFGLIFWVQEVPVNMNTAGMIAIVPIFSMAVAALGLLAGSFFDVSERAMVILPPTSVPCFFLSGAAWPLEQMPWFVSTIAHLIPSTAGVHTFVPLNQMNASIGDVAAAVATLALLAVGYGLLAGWRLIKF